MSILRGRHFEDRDFGGSGGRIAQLGLRGLGDQGEEQMREQEGSREAVVLAGRFFVTDETFQSLEGEFDAPSAARRRLLANAGRGSR